VAAAELQVPTEPLSNAERVKFWEAQDDESLTAGVSLAMGLGCIV